MRYGWHRGDPGWAAGWLPALACALVATVAVAQPAPAPGAATTTPAPVATPPAATPPAVAPAAAAGAPTALPDVTVAAPEPRYVAPTTRDRIGRIWAPVLIDGQGPYRLVLDTGASSSAITERVATRLGLPIDPESVRLRGVTGTAVASSVKVDTLEVGDLLLHGTTMPIVADAFGGADGVLGAEGLSDKRIVIEFNRDRITVSRSHNEHAPLGFLTLPFKYTRQGGLRVEMRVGPVHTVALIDTGSQVTIGNLALRQALARRRKATELKDDVIGVTQDVQQATEVEAPAIVAGDLQVYNAPIRFSDLYIFDHWKLTSRPALLVGMDLLGRLDTLIIDYRRQELQIRTHP